ncbi:MAG: TlpA disulfide reductase family protein [Bacteroidales bacterium]
MRKLFALAALGALAACTTTPEYHISGTASADLNGQMIYLQTLNSDAEYKSIDSTTVTDGKFEFKGIAQDPQLGLIASGIRQIRPVTLILEKGNIMAKFDQENSVSGTPGNDSLQAFNSHVMEESKKMQAIVTEYRSKKQDNSLTEEEENRLMTQYDAIEAALNKYDSAFIVANNNSLAGTYVLSRSLTMMSAQEVEGFLANATPAFKATPLMKVINEFLAAAKRSEVGAQYTNLTMPNLAGDEISLSDYIGKGKYVLVDFWASWCGPCRREMPVVVEAYKKYADKGFEIVGVSFDDNHEAWEKGVKELGMTWPQMSDLKGWKCEASSVYGIRSIPATLLFDPQGKIIAKNLRGEELDETLAKYLK